MSALAQDLVRVAISCAPALVRAFKKRDAIEERRAREKFDRDVNVAIAKHRLRLRKEKAAK